MDVIYSIYISSYSGPKPRILPGSIIGTVVEENDLIDALTIDVM